MVLHLCHDVPWVFPNHFSVLNLETKINTCAFKKRHSDPRTVHVTFATNTSGTNQRWSGFYVGQLLWQMRINCLYASLVLMLQHLVYRAPIPGSYCLQQLSWRGDFVLGKGRLQLFTGADPGPCGLQCSGSSAGTARAGEELGASKSLEGRGCSQGSDTFLLHPEGPLTLSPCISHSRTLPQVSSAFPRHLSNVSWGTQQCTEGIAAGSGQQTASLTIPQQAFAMLCKHCLILGNSSGWS